MATRYRVELSPRARADAEAIHDAIALSQPRAAEKWRREFSTKLRRLRTTPLMYEVVPEVELAGADFRHFEHKDQRVIYRVQDRLVVIVRVILAVRRLTPEMLQE